MKKQVVDVVPAVRAQNSAGTFECDISSIVSHIRSSRSSRRETLVLATLDEAISHLFDNNKRYFIGNQSQRKREADKILGEFVFRSATLRYAEKYTKRKIIIGVYKLIPIRLIVKIPNALRLWYRRLITRLLGCSFSISHSDLLGACIVSCEECIGIDVQRVKDVQEKLIDRIASPAERAHLAGSSRLEALRLFSAKEAIYKSLRPLPQRCITSWRDITVLFEDSASGTMTKGKGLIENARVNREFTVSSYLKKNWIVTICDS